MQYFLFRFQILRTWTVRENTWGLGTDHEVGVDNFQLARVFAANVYATM